MRWYQIVIIIVVAALALIGIILAVQNLLSDQYDKGYESGREDAYDDGRTEGYNEGYERGFHDAKTSDYDKGYFTGYVEGLSDGQFWGVNETYDYLSDGVSSEFNLSISEKYHFSDVLHFVERAQIFADLRDVLWIEYGGGYIPTVPAE